MAEPQDLGLLMATAFNAQVDGLHEHLVANGYEVFRPVDGYLLRILHDQGRATVSELGEILGVTKQAASQAVQSFERRGYVVVEADADDARRRIVRLSNYGEAARSAAIEFHDRLEHQLLVELGPRKVAALREALAAIVETTAGDASPLVRRLAAIGR